MHKLYLQSLEARFPDPDNEEAALAELAASLPKRAARRMSTLGILLNSVLEPSASVPDGETTLIYATSYTEAGALETYLESMPYASPTAFQTSIHPGGIEQALILRKQPVGPFFPLAGNASSLSLQMLKAAFTAHTPRILLCGGEEKGGWLREFGVAYPRSFAFSLLLSREKAGTSLQFEWDPGTWEGEERILPAEELVRKILHAETVLMGGTDHGTFHIFPA